MRGLIVLGVFVCLFFLGLRAPYIFALAYIWTDLFRPQEVTSLFQTVPISMICGIAAAAAFFFCKDKPGRMTFGTSILIIWAAWMTFATATAVLPEAWLKWDWAFKTAVFAILMPYYLNSRAQIEAALVVIVLSLAANIIPVGFKTAIGGGGYGANLGLVGGGAGIGEGSMLALVSVAAIPFVLWLKNHSVLITWTRFRVLGCSGFIVLALLCALGTFARTGLVAAGVLALAGWVQSRRKFSYAIVVTAICLVGYAFTGDQWADRMSTIKTAGSDTSAMGRVAAWWWTLDYVKEHPLGGGFQIYLINSFDLVMDDGTLLSVQKKAFHSIYFEVLGELGVPGIFMFLSMLGWMLANLNKIRKFARDSAELNWMGDLASALSVATLVFMAGGAFIGVAFQPFFWDIFALGIALRHQAERLAKSPATALV